MNSLAYKYIIFHTYPFQRFLLSERGFFYSYIKPGSDTRSEVTEKDQEKLIPHAPPEAYIQKTACLIFNSKTVSVLNQNFRLFREFFKKMIKKV